MWSTTLMMVDDEDGSSDSHMSLGSFERAARWRYLLMVNFTAGFFLAGIFTSYGLIWQMFSDLLIEPHTKGPSINDIRMTIR